MVDLPYNPDSNMPANMPKPQPSKSKVVSPIQITVEDNTLLVGYREYQISEAKNKFGPEEKLKSWEGDKKNRLQKQGEDTIPLTLEVIDRRRYLWQKFKPGNLKPEEIAELNQILEND